GNLVGITPPGLGPFGSYGGPTQTIPLLPGSPGIDAGTVVIGIGPATDQHDKRRVGAVDIGAFESQGFTLTPVGGSTPPFTPVGTAFAHPLALPVAAHDAGERVDGGVITFTAPSSGPSATLSAPTATIAGGQASVTATANSIAGAYSVTASVPEAASVVFALA